MWVQCVAESQVSKAVYSQLNAMVCCGIHSAPTHAQLCTELSVLHDVWSDWTKLAAVWVTYGHCKFQRVTTFPSKLFCFLDLQYYLLKLWCHHIYRLSNRWYEKLLRCPILRFFAPQGRHDSRINVKFGGPLRRAKFHVARGYLGISGPKNTKICQRISKVANFFAS